MECRSPAIQISGSERIDHENGMLLDYGFLMDHVQSVRNLNKAPGAAFSPFRVFPDPLYHPFEDPNNVSTYPWLFCDFLLLLYVLLKIANTSVSLRHK